MSELTKPFYFRPPWDILFDPQRLQKINPWSINISFLLISFLEEMERMKIIDFRASGVALDSSALIYLLKSNLLLKLERFETQSKLEPEEPDGGSKKSVESIPLLFPPLRYELTTTNLESLLRALEETLQQESSVSIKVRDKPLLTPPEVTPIISAYIMDIEEKLQEIFEKICALYKSGETVTLSSLIKGLSKIEAIRVFIVLLFLAHRGRISLLQHEGSEEIYVAISEEAAGQDGCSSD